ncbi:MAG: hypothetical protein L0J48_03050 [Alkalibacterium sp.]|uniref:Uncharacterized protein n=1 Tax=Alkalibacterium gilvum TaxID=1130080 RepID=A0A1H6VIM9_9LACT|nr:MULTISPECIES: hypothetical protein [Alkalibacterium]MDN6195270.1 hypothetical protein [Atopostipes suicloacalis]MDN6294074.1 hypothetical protein [Alkalibacterium sp.]MDN6295682.1 hypothetical protein [Alkalibacterium sp.]MDN6326985.1 hypothetical protein [Alkalibacterium sp.]MDN6385531.1 hypothetical protein [Alkalibacterium sp.]
MEDNQWLKAQLEQLESESQDYKQKALLQATVALLLEQEKREEQLQGELDGTLWSPGNWTV